MNCQPLWIDIGLQKRKDRESLIPDAWRLGNTYPPGSNVLDVPRLCGILTPAELNITSDYDAVDLIQSMKEGRLSCEAVTLAFCKRAAVAQQLSNCLTEIFFDSAIERARSLDAQRKANPSKPLGPFFGLPISLKDSFNLDGIDSTIGLTCYVNQTVTETSSLAEILLELGAILYCKTNVPQSMMTVDSDNHVFGRTVNPINTSFTAGGSSGGEGALIALRGSVLGVGTDIGGSIRMPALCCGIYGMKPSAGIVPFRGSRNPVHPGFLGHAPSAGPMATSTRACRYFLEVIMKAEPWRRDGSCHRISWQPNMEDLSHRHLRIGVVENDGTLSVTPPMRRALQESSVKLSQAGHTIIPIQLPDTTGLERSFMGAFALDGNEYLKDLLATTQEPPVPSVKAIGILDGQPMPLKNILDINASRGHYVQLYNDLWRLYNLDLIMLPPAPHTAIPHDTWRSIAYTGMWNFVDCPAMVLPVGVVEDRDVTDTQAQFGESDKSQYSLYTGPERYRGLPISIQLVAQRFNDQGLLIMAESVDKILNNGA